ncbi:YbhB/YbcL family Raf kinase inhibitor-like protein [Haloactinomyces albus]|uniref:Raf kinase inhibitor-like YbhB/YbcL family protein n=1 Tax=Haloactinomyces albus TaxID=1352928 RepID=A0AAE4CNW0_9ACTN|nr:YbhB/YbcL family Raf kinase inhibitor-like protein [Haloactinomyces albus]MDR7304254.1 Raf kinase inhibitor-like YbhB/YbcL family protein [Haloactinomyces albus]
MPEPGSHKYDIKRARLRNDYEKHGVPDQRADEAASEQLHRDNPLPTDPRTGEPAGRSHPGEPGAQGVERDIEGGGIQLRSSTFNDHTLLPLRCSRDGDNVSPALVWEGIPDGTREIALLCEDPDAPGGTFVHWLMSRIPPETTGLAEGQAPEGAIRSRNGFGEVGWGGPHPPVGDEAHRYFFRIYAADQPLKLGEESTPDDLRQALSGSELARGNIVGLYER